MPYGDLIARVDFDMTRTSAFSYTCHACKRCCRNKAIRVNPYELLRLARRLGLSTTLTIAHYTEAGGTVLRQTNEGDCVFLGPEGCTVHPDRPLACRLYPLARWTTPAGVESFGTLAPHPSSEGEYGTGGTVEEYLDGQDTAEFFEVGARYGELYQKLVDALAAIDPDDHDRRAVHRAEIEDMQAGSLASPWTDIDAMLGDAAGDHDRRALVARHIAAIEAWLAEAPVST